MDKLIWHWLHWHYAAVNLMSRLYWTSCLATERSMGRGSSLLAPEVSGICYYRSRCRSFVGWYLDLQVNPGDSTSNSQVTWGWGVSCPVFLCPSISWAKPAMQGNLQKPSCSMSKLFRNEVQRKAKRLRHLTVCTCYGHNCPALDLGTETHFFCQHISTERICQLPAVE